MSKINKTIFKRKYQQEGETFEELCKRVAFNKEQAEAIERLEFIPAGRQLAGRGFEDKKTLFNCYVLGHKDDSLKSIGLFEQEADAISSRGGGIGGNFSILRPKGTQIKDLEGISTSGALSFMDRFAYAQSTLVKGGYRREAIMLALTDSHPEIFEFIRHKQDLNKMNNVNISVVLTDSFLQKVTMDEDFDLIFPDIQKIGKENYNKLWNGDIEDWKKQNLPIKVYKTVKARDLWNEIVSCAWNTGEPGVLFYDSLNNPSNFVEKERINVTNPCGEQPLVKHSSCNLGSINLKEHFDYNYYAKTKELTIDFEKLDRSIKIGVEYLDQAIDAEHYFNDKIKANQLAYRQIGLGVIGYADLLLLLKLKYGSEEALNFTEKIAHFILDRSYWYSSLLAKKKGKAPLYNEINLNTHYLNKCTKQTREHIEQYGLRNSTIVSIAPTGSISMLANVNGGIEPYLAFEYIRQDVLGTRKVVPNIIEHIRELGIYDSEEELAEYMITAQSLSYEKHIFTQAIWQKYCDNSISKTINLPNSATKKDISNAYMLAHELGIKGLTVYRDGSRDGVLKTISKTKNDKVISEGIKMPENTFIKRSKIKTLNKKYYFMVGYLDKEFTQPFEFFIISNHNEKNNITEEVIDALFDLALSSGVSKEIVLKIKKNMRKQKNSDKIAKIISLCLRHNISIIDIINVLDSYNEKISSLLFWIKKHLETLVEDGTEKKDEKCPVCGNKLIYVSGCVQCIDTENCGYSKC